MCASILDMHRLTDAQGCRGLICSAFSFEYWQLNLRRAHHGHAASIDSLPESGHWQDLKQPCNRALLMSVNRQAYLTACLAMLTASHVSGHSLRGLQRQLGPALVRNASSKGRFRSADLRYKLQPMFRDGICGKWAHVRCPRSGMS